MVLSSGERHLSGTRARKNLGYDLCIWSGGTLDSSVLLSDFLCVANGFAIFCIAVCEEAKLQPARDRKKE